MGRRCLGLGWLLSVLLLVPLRGAAVSAPRAALAVIAHKGVLASKLSRDELRPLFQTKKDTWPDGANARPFNLPDSSPQRQAFDQAVLGLDPDRVARYWIDRKIRGGERPPQTAPSTAVMVKVIGKTPGAVGYVDAALVDNSVKVLAKVIDGEVVGP